ncbi:6-bladed beta-propeller [uncultured Draconibacterium sp.]|uniref:6-bladed beta-propeller n=1 Tax=uncultured Draconibacterium sp. TaxID=1573823 RepID=UPI00321758BC
MKIILFKSLLLFSVLVVIFACNQKDVSVADVKTIELKGSQDFLPISSFIAELGYLELQVSEAGYEMGEITDVKVLDGDLIVKQRKARELSFLRFSETGRFLNEIVNNKNEEISNPLDVVLYKNGYAILGENGICEVSKDGKNLKKIISAEMAGESFFVVKNTFYVISETGSNEFLTQYSENKKAKNSVRIDQRFDKLMYTDVAHFGKQNYHLLSSFSDVIYTFVNNKLMPLYKLDGGNYATLNEVWQNVGDRDTKETMRYIYDTQHVLVKNFLENDDIIFITYWVGSSSTTLIIKKADWEMRYYGRGVNDIDGGIWDRAMHLSDKNELYIPISSGKIGGHKITNKWHKEFENLQAHIASTGNPVIMKCRLK